MGSAGIEIQIQRSTTRAHAKYKRWIESSSWLRYFEEKLEEEYRFPKKLKVFFRSCEDKADEALGAFYITQEHEISICYEQMDYYAFLHELSYEQLEPNQE